MKTDKEIYQYEISGFPFTEAIVAQGSYDLKIMRA